MMSQILEGLFNLSDVAIAGKFADYRALGIGWLNDAAGDERRADRWRGVVKDLCPWHARHDCFYMAYCKNHVIPP